MAAVGYIALALVVVAVLIAVAVLIFSIKDIRRYSRIRKM
jgi:hypothetical protein